MINIFHRNNNLCAALSYSKNEFTMLLLSCSGKRFSVKNIISEKIADNESMNWQGEHFSKFFDCVFSKITPILSKYKCRLRIVLPFSDVLMKTVDFAGLSVDEAKSALQYEFENYFPSSASGYVYDVAPTGGTHSSFLAAAVRRPLIEIIEKSAENFGVDIAFIEPAHSAFERAISALACESDDDTAYIFAGGDVCKIVLLRGGTGIFFCGTQMALNDVTFIPQQIIDAYNFGVERCSNFCAKKIYCYGEILTENIFKELSKAFAAVQCKLINPLSLIEMDKDSDELLCLAFGACLRQS